MRNGHYPDDPRSRKQARALAEAGYRVDVLCLKGDRQPLRENVDGVNVYRVPIGRKRTSVARYLFQYALSFLTFSLLLTVFHLRRRYRCIHVATMPDFLVFATVVPRLLGAKVLLDLHEPTPELWVTKYGNHLRALMYLQTGIERSAIRYADATITVTDELRDRVIARGAPREKVSVVRNVCDELMFRGVGERPMNRPQQGFCLITHGLIEPRYGHEDIIRAVAGLRDEIPGLKLQIVGSGEYESELVWLVGRLGCQDMVEFTGYVPHDELVARLQAADAAVIAMRRSPYSELIDTNKMYEYMALQKPIIISRLKPVARNFDDSCVKFFEPGNHEDLARRILELSGDPQQGRSLAENAYRRYERMRWQYAKLDYVRLVQHLVTPN